MRRGWPGFQDRDGALALIDRTCETYPTLVKLFADGGDAGQKLKAAVAHVDRLSVDIIKRCDTGRFVVRPQRRIVERPLAWLNRCRRLARDREAPAPFPKHGWSSHSSGE